MTPIAQLESASGPFLTIVIPTVGRPSLLATLNSLFRARGADRCEILVVGCVPSGATLEGLDRLLRAHPNARHVQVSFPRGDSSCKKNEGARLAQAPLVAFLDDDVVVSEEWPIRISEPFADPRVGLVSGPARVPEDLPLFARLAGHALASPAAGYVAERYGVGSTAPRAVRWSRLIGCNMAYRRSVLNDVGGFDPAFWPGEEMLAAYRATRAGHILMFHPAAWVYHYPRATPRAFLRQIFTYGATRVRLMRAGVEFEPVTVLPAALVALAVGLGVAAFGSVWARRLWLWGFGLYACADGAIVAVKTVQTRHVSSLLLLAVIPLMHASYGLGEWVEWFRPARDFSETPAPGTGAPARKPEASEQGMGRM